MEAKDPFQKQKQQVQQQRQKSQNVKEQNNQNHNDLQIGPNPRKLQKLEYHELVLDNLPSGENYELSYMHRDTITIILASNKRNLIITVSVDGHIKFWQKVFNLIEFMKNFKAHSGLITSATFNKNHDLLASVGVDKTLKLFDVLNCDLRTVVKLSFSPYDCIFIPQMQFDWELLAVSEEKTTRIMIIDPFIHDKKVHFYEDQQIISVSKVEDKNAEQNKNDEHSSVIKTLTFHKHPVKALKMDWYHNICFSIDQRAFLQVWDPYTFDFPTGMKYSCKIQTQFLKMLSLNTTPISLSISSKAKYLAVVLKDRSIRVFSIETGKIIATIQETLSNITQNQQIPTNTFYIEQNEYQRKMHIQKDVETSKDIFFNPNVEFDETQQFLIYTSFYGLKFYSLSSKNVQRVIGMKQHQRFVRLALYQGPPMRNPAGSSTAQGQRRGTDPTFYCTSFRKPRFYIFSRRQPDLNLESGTVRDVINERPNKEQIMVQKLKQQSTREKEVILQTTMGDIHLELFIQDCPKACENFIKLSKKKYYDGLIFHRVIKGFMIQSGCPKGDGTGGQSIWGGYFGDQLCPEKHRFDKPYVLAMANRGANTNGSQFFITVVPCPWLDNKHTIFGRVMKGVSTVIQINKLKTDKGQKPLMPVKIMSARVIKPNSDL